MIWTPNPFQPEMVQHLLDNTEATLWAGCGSGKTVVSLTAIADLISQGVSKGALVIAPFRVLATSFPSQVEKWDHLRWLTIANMRTPEGHQAWEQGSADLYLVNSEMLPTISRTIKCRKCKGSGCGKCDNGFNESVSLGFVDRFIKKRKTIPVDILLVDEISIAKNPSSVRFNSLRPYLHDIEKVDGKRSFVSPFRRRYGMTGTPHPNSYLDLFAQIRLIDGGKRFGMAFTRYRDRYFQSDYMGFKWELKQGAKEEIDAKIADIALVMPPEYYPDLPPCITEDVEITLPADAMKAYRTLEKELLVELETGTVEALSAAALTTKLLQLTSGQVFDAERDVHVTHDAKVKALHTIRKKHPKEPLIVFTSYIHERERILKEFPEAREFDEKRIPEWQAGKIKMWVSDCRSLAFGIDGLQVGGRICVWMTPTYSWEMYHQAISRLVRVGQNQETLIYRVIALGTVDEAVVEAVRNKEEGNSGLMTSLRNLQRLKKTA